MNHKILYLFTRTPLHVGAGASVGAIDQPIQRERHTRYPIIPGSSIKGVLRDHFSNLAGSRGDAGVLDLFGKDNKQGDDERFLAGKIAFGEAQLVLFPVRSAKGSFAMATSTLALNRLRRDAELDLAVPPTPDADHCLAGEKVVISRASERGVVLEEYRLDVDGAFPSDWESFLSSVLDDAVLQGARGRFVLLSDGDFSHYAENACQVSQHVRIDPESGTADGGGLFNEETVPSEALFAATLTLVRPPKHGNPVFDNLRQEQLLQFGGNGTTGLGFCTAKLG
ncbi:MAG: type III-B CRISPR module RAMP protein Cmr4 [Verrucomicrobiales bacterium]|nr:type III-B CRISPR module RAMP protein Cmr4 [Verrucomicrobiae bacterium]